MGLEHFSYGFTQPHRLYDKALQFFENGRRMICAVVFLIADSLYRDQAAALQARQNDVDRSNVQPGLAGQVHRHAMLLFVAVAEAAGLSTAMRFEGVIESGERFDHHSSLVMVNPAAALSCFALRDLHHKIIIGHSVHSRLRGLWRTASAGSARFEEGI